MVKRFLKILHTEISGLHQAAYLLGFFAFLSQLLALVRDRLLAYSFGASHALDIYYAAFRFPDFVFAAIASMVSISVLIPILIGKVDKDVSEARRFVSNIFSVFLLAITVVSIILFFLMPQLIDLVFPGFMHDPLHGQLITLSRILLLSPIFLGLSNFFASITQVYNRFFIYALSPLLYNVGIIIGIVVLFPLFGLKGLAFGVVIGAFAHLFIQLPFVFEKELFPRFTLRIRFQEIWIVISQSLPRTIAISGNEIAEFLMIRFASLMSAGAISIYNFSWNLQSVPLSIIGVSYSLAAFPTLAKLYSSGEKEKFIEHVRLSARHIIFLLMPVAVLFIVLRAQIVRVILGSGRFNWDDTRLTAAALAVFIVSLIAQSLITLLVRAFYSKGETRKPLIINLSCSILIVVLGFVFTKFYTTVPMLGYFIESLLRVSDLTGTEVLMLPLAYSVSMTINLIIIWWAFEREFPGFSKPILRTVSQSFSVAVLMGYVAYVFLNVFSTVFSMNTVIGVFLQGFCSGIIAIAVGIVLLKMMGSPELHDMWQTLHRKIWKAPVVVAEDKELIQ